MIISLVVAIADNNGIGVNNELLWHLPADLKHFKNITSGHTIIMGRNTYDSIGKPLPNRTNIIITRNTSLNIDGCTVVNSVDEALQVCEEETEIFIIGGAEIYKQTLAIANKIHLTKVHTSPKADAFFPEIPMSEWRQTAIEHHKADEKNAFDYDFITLERK